MKIQKSVIANKPCQQIHAIQLNNGLLAYFDWNNFQAIQ